MVVGPPSDITDKELDSLAKVNNSHSRKMRSRLIEARSQPYPHPTFKRVGPVYYSIYAWVLKGDG